MLHTDMRLCPSMMCADFDRLAEDIALLDTAGADGFHLDVMDGMFVPNYALGLEDIRCVRRHTQKPLEAHLMVMEPASVAPLFIQAGVDIIVIHAEADRHAARTLSAIRAAGKSPGIALNPGTSIETIRELLPLVDVVLAMTVNPGFAGQAFLTYVEDKLTRLMPYKRDLGFRLQVDGGLSRETIARLAKTGVDSFVLGTAGLFGHGPYADTMPLLRAAATGH